MGTRTPSLSTAFVAPTQFRPPCNSAQFGFRYFSPTHIDPYIYAHDITRSSLAIPIPGLNHYDPPWFLGPMRIPALIP